MSKRSSIIKQFALYLLLACLFFTSANAAEANNETVFFESGAEYIGEVIFGSLPHGRGTVVWPDGASYDGEFFNGMLHGKGTLTYDNEDVYTGDFSYGYRSGKGTMTFANGDTYTGEWSADMMHGNGKYTFKAPDPARPKKNDVYSGAWCFNMMHGKGTYTYANGKSQSGYWLKNQYMGSKLTNEIKAALKEWK